MSDYLVQDHCLSPPAQMLCFLLGSNTSVFTGARYVQNEKIRFPASCPAVWTSRPIWRLLIRVLTRLYFSISAWGFRICWWGTGLILSFSCCWLEICLLRSLQFLATDPALWGILKKPKQTKKPLKNLITLAMLCSMVDLSSTTKDWTRPLQWKRAEP